MKKLSLLLILALTGFTSNTSCFFWTTQSTTTNIHVEDYDKNRDYAYVIEEFQRNWKDLIPEEAKADGSCPTKWITNLFYSIENNPNFKPFRVKILYAGIQPIGFIIYVCHHPRINDLVYPGPDGQIRPLPDIAERLNRTANISFLVINKAYRGHHYAEILLHAALKDLKSHNIQKALLITDFINYNSRKLYERMGFEAVARDYRHIYYFKDLS